MIVIMSFIGCVLVAIGVVLTFQCFGRAKNFFGWVIASIGMLLTMTSAIASHSYIFAVLSAIFAIGNVYYAVDSYKLWKKSTK